MMSDKIKITILQLLCLALIFSGCEYDGPDEIYDPNVSFSGKPVINAIVPADSAAGGVNEVRLVGENFSAVAEENHVYLNGVPVPVKRASVSELAIARPAMIGEGLSFRVVVDGKYEVAQKEPYKITQVVFDLGDFSGSNRIYGIALDNDGNLYATSAGRFIWKLTPDGVQTEFVETSFRSSTDIQVGPGGVLYVASIKKYFDRFALDGSFVDQWGAFPENAEFFDFDANGNIYVGTKLGLFSVKPDGSASSTIYAQHRVKSVKVFDDYVYLATEYRGTDASVPKWGIWRNRINADGTLGANEVYFDWANSGIYATTEIKYITFSAAGVLFIGTDREAADPILLVNPDGSWETLYIGYIGGLVDEIIWGPDNFIYLNRGNASTENRVQRIDMGQPGAPYFGRN